MQNFKFLVDGETIFDVYPEYINNMIKCAISDFAGSTPPTGDYLEIGMTYFNTVEKKRYRYEGEETGWVPDLNNILNEVKFNGKTLEDNLVQIASQNAGNTFPTGINGVWVGMPCYRKDLQAIYICTEYDPQGVNHKWTDITNLSPNFGILKDDVLAARGTARSLSARLDVALNHDGTLKGTAPAGEWWEPATPYNFTKTDTSTLTLNDDGDYTALFEVDRAVLLHPSHNKAYVVSSAYDEETNKTSVTIDEEIGADTQIQFGAPVGNSSKTITEKEVLNIFDNLSQKQIIARRSTLGGWTLLVEPNKPLYLYVTGDDEYAWAWFLIKKNGDTEEKTPILLGYDHILSLQTSNLITILPQEEIIILEVFNISEPPANTTIYAYQ